MRLSSLFFLLFLAGATFAQDTLSGVVNSYAAVTQLDFCQGRLILGPASGQFSEGQKVLLMQMQGASIDESNSSAFGTIQQLNHAGHFEENEILELSGDTVWLRNTLLHHYDVSAAVQLIGFPQIAGNAVLDGVTCQPWNGAYGGVLAVHSNGSISLLSDVDVDGMGFGDEFPHEVVSNCTWLTFANNYHYPSANWRGAPKGQGIAKFIPDKEHGRGPQANGGGGGNDHNSGGGGGAHAGIGGQGGRQTPSSAFGCSGNFPGLGGRSLPLSPTRLFMGGEGGNGHVDDNNAGSPGARGGGILLLITDTLITNGFGLSANGNTPPLAGGDGAGGGGAGGSIYLSAGVLIGNTTLSAAGGDGGDVTNPTDRCFGPGGGGSGGRIVATAAAGINTNVAGGEAGENTTASPQCSGPSNGAEPGQTGAVEPLFPLPGSNEQIVETLILAQPQPATVCEGDTASFQFQVQGNFLHYQWQLNDTGNWTDLPNDTLPELSLATEGLYRCVVSSPCAGSLISDEVQLTVQQAPLAAFDAVDTGDGLFQFQNNSLNATTWQWDFGDASLSAEENPVHQYQNHGAYTVVLIASNDCSSDTAVAFIEYVPAPVAAFSLSPAEGCAPLTVAFENNAEGDSLQFFWSFPGGNPASSTEADPVVVYAAAGNFDVQLVVQNAFGADTLLQQEAVSVHPVPAADFTFTADSLTVQFQSQSQGGQNFLWEFGDGTSSTEENPAHTYQQPGIYEVTLTVSNGPCGATVAQTVAAIPNATGENTWPGLNIYPNPSRGFVHLSFGEHVNIEGVEIQVFNSLGIEIFKAYPQQKDTSLDLHHLAAGVYFLVLKKGEGRVLVPLVMIGE
ncbi:MAG: hypothetical protein Kow0027_09330 [Saprospiraceae bacterium]